jgi:hypothetical protein
MKGSAFGVRLLAGVFVFMAGSAWADYRLSQKSIEEELGLATSTVRSSDADPFGFDPQRWKKTRATLERGEEPGKESPPVLVSTAPVVAPPPEKLGFNVDLPYDSGLSISGRKLIALKINETRRKSAESAKKAGVPQNQRDVDIDQELQVRIKGKVGPKITVNVDFDDTKDDRRDISVVYKGDPEELVQEAAFGDITLSLPSTKFVSYSKQVFGLRTELKYKRAKLMAIGSRTKGITETKRFTGNTKFEKREIVDTAYISRRYYDIGFSTVAIVPGSEEVWRDDRISNNVNTTSMTVEDFGVVTSTFTGDFDQLAPGKDYTIDVVRKLIIFNTPLAANAVVAVGFPLADSSTIGLGASRRKLIKTENDSPLITSLELGYQRELKTFYSIGQTKIVPDNGRGNFILKVVDLNGTDTTVPLTDGDDLAYPKNIQVDFAAGLFNIVLSTRVVDESLYAATKIHKFSFLMEYRFRFKTYQVKPNMVLGSERVSIDGRLMIRDLDYFIDYGSGFLTFFDEDQIGENSQIEVTYEFSPFGQVGETLLGSRLELDLIPKKLFLGSTFLRTVSPTPSRVPDIRSTPASLLILEADTRVTDVAVPFTPLKMNLSAEVAQSRENPNRFGKALVDSMEGIKQETQAILSVQSWQPSFLPPPSGVGRLAALSSVDEDVALSAILDPTKVVIQGNEKQRVLTLNYNLGASEQIGLVQSLSQQGQDFSKRLTLELWVEGAGAGGAGVDLIVDAGQFNEDADGDGKLDTEDLNNDGTLNEGEDVGWTYNDPVAGSVKIGGTNGRLDSEDLDRDGKLLTSDKLPRTIPLFTLSTLFSIPGARMLDSAGNSQTHVDLSFTGWRFIQVPLNILAAEEDNFRAIKQVRTILKGAGDARVRLGKISFVGNRWEKPVSFSGSTMTVSAINNRDNPDYPSLIGNGDFNNLYEDESGNRTREQALALSFTLPTNSTSTTRTAYNPALNFSKHETLQFFLRSPHDLSGAEFFLQLGSETDYFEYSLPLSSRYKDSWVLESLHLADLNDDGTPDTFRPVNAAGSVSVVGKPILTSVGQMKLGVRKKDGVSSLSGDLWVNEIHLTGSRKKNGQAHRAEADFTWPGWGSFGGTVHSKDRNFQTITSPIVNQDESKNSGQVTFSRLRALPLSGTWSRSKTVTPASLQTGSAGLVSVLSEGREETIQGDARGQLLLPSLPAFGFGYNKDISKSINRQDVRNKDTYTGSMDYSLSWKPDLLSGEKLVLRPLPETVFLSYTRINHFLSVFPEKRAADLATSTGNVRNTLFADVRVVELTDDWSSRLRFSPWNGFVFTPTFALKKVREERRFTLEDLALVPDFKVAQLYDKSLTQKQGLALSLRIFSWFEPRINYTVDGTETYDLPTASSPTAFNLKTLDRTGNGDASWTFSARNLMPKFRLTQSFVLDNSFRIESGDQYEKISRDFGEWRRVSPLRVHTTPRANGGKIYGILDPLDPPNPGARRKQLTLRNTLRSSGNWSPLNWWSPRLWGLQPLRTINLTATLTHTEEHTQVADTVRDTVTRIWPDYTFSIREMEKPFFLARWVKNSQLNIRPNRKRSKTFDVEFSDTKNLTVDYRFSLFRRYEPSMDYSRTASFSKDLKTSQLKTESEGTGYSLQVPVTFGPWRYTPRASFRTDLSRDGTGRISADLTLRTYSVSTRFDKSYPQGLRLPFSKKVYGNINRFTLDAKLNYEQKKSSLNFERDNTNTYSADLTGEYEISQNFRLSVGGGSSLTQNRARKEEGSFSFSITSRLVIQF